MDNQHKKITGYRDLSQAEIDLMNEAKAFEEQAAQLVQRVQQSMPPAQRRGQRMRDLALARTAYEDATIRLVRAIAFPASPWGTD